MEQVLGICLEDDAWEGGVCPWRQAPGPAGRGTWPWLRVAVAVAVAEARLACVELFPVL